MALSRSVASSSKTLCLSASAVRPARTYAASARPPSRARADPTSIGSTETTGAPKATHYAPPPVPSPTPGRTPVRQTQRLIRNTAKFLLERSRPEDAVEVPVGLIMSYYDACAGQANAEFEFFHHDLGLPENFSTWFNVTTLHVWLLNCRLRALLPPYGRAYQQHLISMFFGDVEARMKSSYGVKKSGQVDKYARDTLHRYHGAILAYDEGLLRGDATLASALWRNFMNAGDLEISTDGSETTSEGGDGLPKEARQIVALEQLVQYVHRELHRLGQLPDSNVLGSGKTEEQHRDALGTRFSQIVSS